MLQDASKIFSDLYLWDDLQPRTGAENMAVDQVLMESCDDTPLLRVYRWAEPTVSFGYFTALEEARLLFPAEEGERLTYIRRWTGGGVVDHRVDVTYTLVVPRGHAVARSRGAESYRLIHHALADALAQMGELVRLRDSDTEVGGANCFRNPVEYDLTNGTGSKVAGAGQRRSRYGLLHQGSVIPQMERRVFQDELLSLLGAVLADQHQNFQLSDYLLVKAQLLANTRYRASEWLTKK